MSCLCRTTDILSNLILDYWNFGGNFSRKGHRQWCLLSTGAIYEIVMKNNIWGFSKERLNFCSESKEMVNY